jgi:hypothetical protein
MGVFHCFTEWQKQAQALCDIQTVAVAILVQGHPVDVLHDEVRHTVSPGASVQQSRDIGVGEAGQQLALIAKAVEGAGIEPGVLDHLNGDRLVKLAIHAIRFEDHAHAAMAKNAARFVGAEPVAGAYFRRLFGGNALAEEGFRASIGVKKGEDFVTGLGADSGVAQKFQTVFRRQLHSLYKERPQRFRIAQSPFHWIEDTMPEMGVGWGYGLSRRAVPA